MSHAGDRPPLSIAAQWDRLVTAALLGTDRRDPPEPEGAVADLVDDTVRTEPSQRMLAQVAACAVVRRAGVRPGPPVSRLQPPSDDERPACSAAAVARWHHIVRAWPVLEDEWMLVLLAAHWRAAPELVPTMLRRHRGDPVRRARVLAAAGPLGPWLVDHLPDLASSAVRRQVTPEAIGELPELPIPAELEALLGASGAAAGGAIGAALESGAMGASHRAVLINLVARIDEAGLEPFADVLGAVEPNAPGHALATVLVDLATTRRRMLDELDPIAAR